MQTFLTAIIAFASTNIDDIFVLMALFSHVNHQTFRIKHIVVGQFIGILSLTVISFIGALGLFFVPVSWIGLLGLIPLYIGVKGLLSINKSDQEDDAPIIDKQNKAAFGGATLKVAAITIGNGGDNIAYLHPHLRNKQHNGDSNSFYHLFHFNCCLVFCRLHTNYTKINSKTNRNEWKIFHPYYFHLPRTLYPVRKWYL